MKTDDLIALLSTGIKPVDPYLQRKYFALAITIGGASALLLMLLLFGIRADIGLMLMTPLFWLKLAFPLSLAASALWLLTRLSRPGVVIGKRWLAPAMPVLVIWLAAAAALAVTPADTYAQQIMGLTWKQCPFNITLLSLPGCASLVWAMRQLAPTQPVRTGMLAGLLAASVATIAYCLHCPEMGIPFWGIWYLLGMLMPALLGAAFGRVLLRW